MAEKGRGSSKVWDYFTKRADKTVTGNICGGEISRGSSDKPSKFNTSNLWYHLSKEHKDEHDEVAAHKHIKKAPTLQQTTLPQVFDKVTKWKSDDPRSKKIDRLVVEMISTDCQPYTMVEDVGFKRFVAALEPRYTMKTEKYYRTTVLDQVHGQLVARIKQLLENAGEDIAFTTDCWSGTTEALMSLTAHFVTKEWERVQVILNVTAMKERHTAEYISELFLQMLDEWAIDSERVMLVLRDNGSNVVKAMRLMEKTDLGCCAHTLQLVVNDGLASQRVVGDIIAKLKNVATHFNHSISAKQKLQVIQKQVGAPEHSILQATPTRWNSVLHMLQRMLEQKQALALYAAEHGHFTCPTSDEWDIVAKLITTLSPIEEETKEMCREDASIACILPTVGVLRRYLRSLGEHTRGIQTLRKEMLDSLNRRFGAMEKNREELLACILDPRYKQRPLSDTAAIERAKMWLQEESVKISGRPSHAAAGHSTEASSSTASTSTAVSCSSDASSSTASTSREGPSRSLLDSLYDDMLLSQAEPEEPVEGVLEKLERFWKEPVLDRKTGGDPLQWWMKNSHRFMLLSPLAQRFLTPPPTSVPGERVFSTEGNIYDDRRSSLLGANAEKLCFMYYNLRLLDWEY